MIESKAAGTVLQDDLKVKVGMEVYKVAPPTLTSIIRISELVSHLPLIDNGDSYLLNLKNAKQGKVLADLAATLILGEELDKKIEVIKNILGFKVKRKTKVYDQIVKDALKMRIEVLGSMVLGLLSSAVDLDAFFLLMISLSEFNILKAKKKRTTPSGQ